MPSSLPESARGGRGSRTHHPPSVTRVAGSLRKLGRWAVFNLSSPTCLFLSFPCFSLGVSLGVVWLAPPVPDHFVVVYHLAWMNVIIRDSNDTIETSESALDIGPFSPPEVVHLKLVDKKQK